MDFRDKVMADRPQDFLHKIAGIVPGFNGYMDRERRRDADKLLRTYLAHQYSAQRDRLNRVQQTLVRAGQITGLSEVDRLVGVLQRFIDRLSTATYGYSGLFDPVKVDTQELDQLYAFDMALTSGVDEVSSAIGGVESAVNSESANTAVPAALSKLSSVLDDLNMRLNQRNDLLTSGQGLPPDQYNSLVNSLGTAPAPGGPTGMAPPPPPPPPPGGYSGYGAPPPPPPPSAAPSTSAPPPYMSGTPSTDTGTPTTNTSGGEMARYPGGYSGYTGTPDTGSPAAPSQVPPYPAGTYSGTPEAGSGAGGSDTTDLRGAAPDYGVNTASSPSAAPGAQGGGTMGDMPAGGAVDSSADATEVETPSDKPQQ